MNQLKSIIIFIVVIILTVLAFLLFANKNYSFEKEVFIKNDAQSVFNYVKFLKNQESYHDWFNQDVDKRMEYVGEDGVVGSKFLWFSDDKNLRSGEEVISVLNYPKHVQMKMNVSNPTFVTAVHDFKIEENSEGCKLKWRIAMHFPFPNNFAMIFNDFEDHLSKSMEVSLKNIRKAVE